MRLATESIRLVSGRAETMPRRVAGSNPARGSKSKGPLTTPGESAETRTLWGVIPAESIPAKPIQMFPRSWSSDRGCHRAVDFRVELDYYPWLRLILLSLRVGSMDEQRIGFQGSDLHCRETGSDLETKGRDRIRG